MIGRRLRKRFLCAAQSAVDAGVGHSHRRPGRKPESVFTRGDSPESYPGETADNFRAHSRAPIAGTGLASRRRDLMGHAGAAGGGRRGKPLSVIPPIPGASALAAGAYSLYLTHKAVFPVVATALADAPAGAPERRALGRLACRIRGRRGTLLACRAAIPEAAGSPRRPPPRASIATTPATAA